MPKLSRRIANRDYPDGLLLSGPQPHSGFEQHLIPSYAGGSRRCWLASLRFWANGLPSPAT